MRTAAQHDCEMEGGAAGACVCDLSVRARTVRGFWEGGRRRRHRAALAPPLPPLYVLAAAAAAHSLPTLPPPPSKAFSLL